jgi:hypothetical protein
MDRLDKVRTDIHNNLHRVMTRLLNRVTMALDPPIEVVTTFFWSECGESMVWHVGVAGIPEGQETVVFKHLSDYWTPERVLQKSETDSDHAMLRSEWIQSNVCQMDYFVPPLHPQTLSEFDLE